MKEWEGQRGVEEEGWRDRDKGNGFRVTDGLAGGHGQGVSKDWTAVAAAPRLGRRPCPTLPCPPPPVCLSLARLTDVSIYPFLNGGECQREEEGARGRADGRGRTLRGSSGWAEGTHATTT